MSMCRFISCFVGWGSWLCPVPSLGKTLLTIVLLHSVLRGQICLLVQVFLNFLPLHSSPLLWNGHLFLAVSSRRSCRVFIKPFNFSFFSITVWAQTWTTMILNGLPWKRTEIILSFLRLYPSTAFRTLVDYDGYSISSKGFLPTVVDLGSSSFSVLSFCLFIFFI